MCHALDRQCSQQCLYMLDAYCIIIFLYAFLDTLNLAERPFYNEYPPSSLCCSCDTDSIRSLLWILSKSILGVKTFPAVKAFGKIFKRCVADILKPRTRSNLDLFFHLGPSAIFLHEQLKYPLFAHQRITW